MDNLGTVSKDHLRPVLNWSPWNIFKFAAQVPLYDLNVPLQI